MKLIRETPNGPLFVGEVKEIKIALKDNPNAFYFSTNEAILISSASIILEEDCVLLLVKKHFPLSRVEKICKR